MSDKVIKEWKFKAHLPNIEEIIFEYADCPSMKLRYHDHMMFSVVGNNIFPATGPMNYWKIRDHYGKCCAESDPEYFRIEFLEEHHPLVHIYVLSSEYTDCFIDWLKMLGDVPNDAGENEWPE
jgi:hypothetical protein